MPEGEGLKEEVPGEGRSQGGEGTGGGGLMRTPTTPGWEGSLGFCSRPGCPSPKQRVILGPKGSCCLDWPELTLALWVGEG